MTARRRLTSLTRRSALAGAATVGVGVPVLVACSGDDSSTAVDPAGDTGSGTSSSPSSPDASESESSGGGGDAALTTAEDIPTGSGVIFPDEQVVVTQPTAGEFKCFTAVCTHQGCIVSNVADDQIQCACHGSAFSVADGSVINGPATQPLAEQQITVKGDNISLA